MTTTAAEQTYSSTGRAILKCKACKRAGTVDYTLTTTVRAWNGRPNNSTTIQTTTAARPSSLDRTRSNPIAWALHRNCTACRSIQVEVKVVKGTLVETRACDDRCMAATGPNCSCSCGGENHGGGNGGF